MPYQRDPELNRIQARAWAKAHPERVRENARNHYRRNKAHYNELGKAWRKANPEKSRAIMQAYLQRNPWYYSFQAAKARCLNAFNPRYEYYGARGIEFKMTMREFGELWMRDGAAQMVHPSIDRINPEGHYELSNCRFIEKSENSRRNTGRPRKKQRVFVVKQPYLRARGQVAGENRS